VAGRSDWDAPALITIEGNRWSRSGQPTIYLAGDPGVALAEFARHMPAHGKMPQASVWTVDVSLEAVLDLRAGDPTWAIDRERCRTEATEARLCGAQALIVPSLAFLDGQDRVNLVVFVENIQDLDVAIGKPRRMIAVAPT
jgi:RES domain-containing protein